MISSDELLEYRAANVESARRIQQELAAFWKTACQDDQKAREIADLLGVPVEVVRQMADPPVRVKSAQANVGGAEIGLMVGTWLVSEVLLGALKDVLKEEVKRRLKRFWDYASDELDLRMNAGATGTPAGPPDEPDSDAASDGERHA